MDEQRKNPCDQTYQVALYQDPATGFLSVFRFYGESDASYHADIRISEPVEVHFTALRSEQFVRAATEALDAQEQKLRVDFEVRLEAIRQQRANLLALTHQPEVVS